MLTEATAHEIVVALDGVHLCLVGIALALYAIAFNEIFFK